MNLRSLINWYEKNQRALPWRLTRDPYPIWISEVMLQQTTVAAVVPYFLRFIERFPTVYALAESPLEHIYEAWSGLGYYSRARNLHAAAKVISERREHAHLFPRTAAELSELPGFGPYTSRAVASFSFEDRVGVLDGNVIRVWSRFYGEPMEYWRPAEKLKMQRHLDELAESAHEIFGQTSSFNQSVMELGATICTPKKPLCLLCPMAEDCVARKENRVNELPLVKPRRKMEAWAWKPQIIERAGKIAFVAAEKTNSPVLKNQLILPGLFEKLTIKPKQFRFKHTITHHEIFVFPDTITEAAGKIPGEESYVWLKKSEIKLKSPFQIIQRAIHLVLIGTCLALATPAKARAAPLPATSSSTLTSPENFYFLNAQGISVNDLSGDKWTLKERDAKKWTWVSASNPTTELVLQVSTAGETETNSKKLLRDFHNTGFDVIKDSTLDLPEKGQLFELYDPIQKKQVHQYIFSRDGRVAQWLCVADQNSKMKSMKSCDQVVQSFTWMTIDPTLKKDSSKKF